MNVKKELETKYGTTNSIYLNDIEIDPFTIKAIMINEVVPANPLHDFYGSSNADYVKTAICLFQKAGSEFFSIDDILQAGIYITNAVKTPKTEYSIEKRYIENSLPYLETELSLFPNIKVIMLMGDVSKKVFNMIAKKQQGKNIIPSVSTYKLRNSKIYYKEMRIIPSYIMTGGNLLIEKSKVNMITEKEALLRIDAKSLDQLLHPTFDTTALKNGYKVGSALPASPGAAAGKIYFTANDAKKHGVGGLGERVILVRLETTPEDIEGMKAAQGILTVRGGMTSHAAVVARGMGTCCVSGCGDINMDEENKKFTLAGQTFTEGSEISIDGTTGNIYAGLIPTVDASIAGEFGRVMAWADEFRTLKVRTNADTPADAKKARELGAEGIGLCRTEHMFFDPERIAAFREMICSDTEEEREVALDKILPYQQSDFKALYEALEGCPVTIRFLDPPLHEFVPTEDADIEKLAKAKNKSVEEIKAICASLHEFNPMMGHRGCRLAVTYPSIAKMQTKAVIRAAIEVQKEHADWTVKPEIMIPLVCEVKELKYVKNIVVETADAEIAAAGVKLEYEVGTMIEIPRAALTADEIATEADFFCFGTNDLTQMTFGFSRDDAGKFLNAYYDKKIFESDPFAKLDQTGVGKLMETAIKLGKPVNPKLHVGICGEHGGDPSSVEFCHKIGLDYVSCSPFRVPIARLAAAQAAIAEKAAK